MLKHHRTFLSIVASVLVMGGAGPVHGQQSDLSFLLTAAERTEFEETTRYDEMMAFLEVAVSQHPDLHLLTFGYSYEGRALPLVIFGKTASTDPSVLRDSDRIRIFVQGNIHAGEVCGKEALLMLIRSIAEGEHDTWADSALVMMAPMYNTDGNERVNLYNRPRQNGPRAGMGQRPNAQGLDLNRDHMKVRSPEARSLIGLMNAYDPHVLIDLHTTNGTRHGYHLTYSPSLSPNTSASIDSLNRNHVLPAAQQGLKDRSGWESYYYGNLPFRRAEPGWFTFDHRPRFNNNYIGLRNRLAILSEAYAYASFEERILSSLHFTESIIEDVIARREEVIEVLQRAETESTPGLEQGLRFEPVMNDDSVEILMGTVVSRVNPYSGAVYLERTDFTRVQLMPEYGAFAPVESSTIPAAYVVYAESAAVVGPMLATHGISFETLTEAKLHSVEAFVVDSVMVSDRPFQQIREVTLNGAWSGEDIEFPIGSLFVSMDQPLSRLAFYLLEPRSDDGLVNWGFFGDALTAGDLFPVYRVPLGNP
ncbi:MAG: M14 family metallopeptidase [Bacteroidota bacterium]|nr:M14 family metallopeptidase [Bacteroidota bacterium]